MPEKLFNLSKWMPTCTVVSSQLHWISLELSLELLLFKLSSLFFLGSTLYFLSKATYFLSFLSNFPWKLCDLSFPLLSLFSLPEFFLFLEPFPSLRYAGWLLGGSSGTSSFLGDSVEVVFATSLVLLKLLRSFAADCNLLDSLLSTGFLCLPSWYSRNYK